ncbi:MAG TPA: hypothetical protein VMA35_12390 [Candidatus Sulfopaludibacter sp.]|nr:hypothetical protein [Candidatus Sulfopaludibacter sp.]
MKTRQKEHIMKLLTASFALGWLLAAGCLSERDNLVLDPVGPPPSSGAVGDRGNLVVYSAYDPHANYSGFEHRTTYTDYKIFSKDGSLLRKVRNDTGHSLGGPVNVALPTGDYQVEAQANGYGLVKVPVVIKGNQVTVVHLEGGGSWPNRAEMIQTGAVRLPDGRVVGWRAAP